MVYATLEYEASMHPCTVRRRAPFSLSSSARSKPYMCEHLRSKGYTLVTTAGASHCAGA